MATPLPYLPSNKNVGVLFERIHAAKVPDVFNHNFLQTTVGLKGSNDRPLISLLKSLGFLDQAGHPTNSYRLLKGDQRKSAIAEGLRFAYSGVFDAEQNAHRLPSDKLKSLIAQVSGTDVDMTSRIASTFQALSRLADFDGRANSSDASEGQGAGTKASEIDAKEPPPTPLRAEFHYNIQVHLPANGTEEIYLNIFNALRRTFA